MTSIERSYASRLYPRLAVLALGLFVVGTNAFVIAGLLQQIAKTLGVRPSDVSYSITFYSLIVAILAPVMSITLARVSRTTLMAAGLLVVAAGTVIAASAPTLEVFTAGRIVAAFGGAALVPTATAAAAMMSSPERRGRAIGFVAAGFTASTAFGAPIGTALASVSSWRVPMYGIAGLAVLAALAVALFVRDVPLGAAASLRHRLAVLGNPRLLLGLAATLLAVCGFNIVYIFSGAIAAPATGGDGGVLAILLLAYGVAGILGNTIAGRLIDRFGSLRVGLIAIAVDALLLLALPFVVSNFGITAVLFALWGFAVNAGTLPLQHRLVQIDPATSAIALSWFSTALYAGIALAPVLGAEVLGLGNAEAVPVIGAVVTLLAAVAFGLGFVGRRAAALSAT
jgi:DHA1 family inner membrane transport protein